jgi:ATP-dependent DNA helicase RecG
MTDMPSDAELKQAISSMKVAGTDTQLYEVNSCKKELTKDIVRTLSAFSNGSGGTIICGLDEHDGFAPVRGFDAKSIQDSLATYCTEKMTPPVRALIDIRSLEGHPILVARIPEMRPKDKPCYVSASGMYAGSFIRTGDGDRHLSSYEIDRLLEEREQPRHDLSIVGEATAANLDKSLVNALIQRERTIHPRGFNGLNDTDVLRRLHVLREDEDGTLRPTIAGLVALGSYPQEFYPRLNITFSCYPGTSKTSAFTDGRRFLDMATLVGPIPAMVHDCLDVIARNTRTGGRIKGALRYDVPDYPPVAVREAVVNALMHRDYSAEGCGSAVMVDLYTDHLEIINPGGLYGSVTIATLGTSEGSSARNQFLANILESTPYEENGSLEGGFVAENRGTGYRMIQDALAAAGMRPPIPRDTISAFSLTFVRTEDPAAENDGADDMSEGERRVLNVVVRSSEPVSMADMTSELSMSRSTVTKHVRSLVNKGVLAATEPKYSPHQRYRATDSAKLMAIR